MTINRAQMLVDMQEVNEESGSGENESKQETGEDSGNRTFQMSWATSKYVFVTNGPGKPRSHGLLSCLGAE